MISNNIRTDFLIIGSGAAGLRAALEASNYGSVLLLTKSSLEASSSYWAQGGIAAVLDGEDTFNSHIEDTLAAGRDLCKQEAVEILVEEGSRRVQELIDDGMAFDQTNGAFDLGLEGGHSNRRVLHANGASTGKALINFLMKRVREQENIQVVEHAFAFKLLEKANRCRGAAAFLFKQDELLTIQSPTTILATGGYSGLYQRSTNPYTSTGDGLWLGHEIGAELRDLEFVQFHPTAFYTEDGSTFLVSEAVRGEGAYLYNEDGNRFMLEYPQKELSPRDIVSKEIFRQIQEGESSCVYLDVSHLDSAKIKSTFPSLINRIESRGIDIDNECIPVAPAAHYCIGGIATDLNAQSSVGGLYACGEAAATGVHGANRLASNSLLECLVFAVRAVRQAVRDNKKWAVDNCQSLRFECDAAGEESFTQLKNRVSSILSNKVGIVRNAEDMTEALCGLKQLQSQLVDRGDEYFTQRSRGLLNLATMITKSALQRKESRGVHTRADYPETEADISRIIIQNHRIQESLTV